MNLLPTRYWPVALIYGCICLLMGCKQEAPPKPQTDYTIPAAGYPVTVESSGSEQIDKLVSQLVSQRPAPYPSSYWPAPTGAVFAERYSTPEVEAALKRLKEIGPPAFPALIKHLGDDRYSYSFVSEAWLNCSVSKAIYHILCDGHSMHSGYKFRETPSGSGVYLSFEDYLRSRGMETWTEWAKNKSRLDIQMDFIDWCVSEENKRGYIDEAQKKDILKRYDDARQRVKKEYSEKGAALNRLRSIPLFAFGGITEGGVQSDGEKAYRTIITNQDAVELFRTILTNGTSEAKLYALYGIRKLAPATFEASAKSLDKSTPVNTMEGCLGNVEKTSDVLARIRAGDYDVYLDRAGK